MNEAAAPEGRGEPSSGSFLRGLLFRCALLLTCAASLNLLVNPFGAYATRLFEPIILGTRLPKLRLYRQRHPPPAIVVLGSSRSFMVEPAYIETKTSLPAFNAAVHGARLQDYLDFAHCFASNGTFPPLLIVAVGVEQLLGPSPPLERGDPLASCRPEGTPLGVPLASYRGLLTMEETWASLRVLGLELVGRPAPRFSFVADGMIRVSSERPLEEAVNESLAGNWQPNTFSADTLDTGGLAQLRGLLELAREHGSRVVVYLPPYHPRAIGRYLKESRFESLRGQLLGRLASWAKEYPLQFYDFTDILTFGGREDMFHDAAHPSVDADRIMLDVILAGLH